MKILHATDFHFKKSFFKWIRSQENNFDVFCISGDFLEPEKEEPLSQQILWVSDWLSQFTKPLFICSGNHDLEDLKHKDWLEKISNDNVFSDNSIQTIEGIAFGCCAYEREKGYDMFNGCDVLVTHLPPSHTKTSFHQVHQEMGEEELFHVINEGQLKVGHVLCGHVHRPLQTTDTLNNVNIYNPGANLNRDIPNHLIIEI